MFCAHPVRDWVVLECGRRRAPVLVEVLQNAVRMASDVNVGRKIERVGGGGSNGSGGSSKAWAEVAVGSDMTFN